MLEIMKISISHFISKVKKHVGKQKLFKLDLVAWVAIFAPMSTYGYGFESTPGARSWSGGDVCSAGVSHNRRTTPHKLCHASRAAPQITDRSQGSHLEAYFGLVGHWSVTTCLTCSRFSFWQSSTKCDQDLWLICLVIRNVTINNWYPVRVKLAWEGYCSKTHWKSQQISPQNFSVNSRQMWLFSRKDFDPPKTELKERRWEVDFVNAMINDQWSLWLLTIAHQQRLIKTTWAV